MKLTDTQLRRYSRNIILPEVGERGQKKLLASKVLVIGAGGLGSASLMYLAASGVGTIGIVDFDKTELSNLQRQIIHEIHDIGRAKVDSASDAIYDLNPEVKVNKYLLKLNKVNAEQIISSYDIVLDGSDNIETRFLVNDTCHKAKKTLISASILRFEGQVSTFKSYIGTSHPCYRCLYPEPPPHDAMPTCAENGILSPVAGIMGSMQALEAIKEMLNIDATLSGWLLRYDALKSEWHKARLQKDDECIICNKRE